ncbi:MAG: MFS transporter [Akkermansia sp.]|nr:MFS transporter [Akkermansia sp.]
MSAFPPQGKYIIGNEACERFSFYGMRSILTLYMTSMLAMSHQEAVEVGHIFLAIIYVLPLLGAWIADKFLGRYRTILYISLVYCLGNFILATADFAADLETRKLILFAGLLTIAVGTGGIKPCVSAFIGDQVQDHTDSKTMTRVYAAFYWSINLGSFFAFLVIPWIRQSMGYSWAFAVPGIFMLVATLLLWCGRKTYYHRQPTQPHFLPSLLCRVFRGAKAACDKYGAETVKQTSNTVIGIAAFVVLAPIVFLLGHWVNQGAQQLAALSGLGDTAAGLCGLAGIILYIIAMVTAGLRLAAATSMRGFIGVSGSLLFNPRELTESRYTAEEIGGARNMVRVLLVFLMIIPFWSLYDQTTTSWVLQGARMQAITFNIFGQAFAFGAEEMQSFNPLLVMILVPTVTLLVYPYIGKWSRPLHRMGTGIVLAGLAYGVVAWLQVRIDSGEQLSILWQCLPYIVLTVSEILVSTTGLEYAYTAAGQNMKSIVLSFWYLTSTIGNFLIVYLTSIVGDPASTSTFILYGSMAVVIGIIFMLVTFRKSFSAGQQ